MRKDKDKKREPVYMIGAVSRMYNIHPQTLRLYEREGLLVPSRTEGKTRLYSQEDLEKLEFILFLTRELGVNLAGVDAILRMKEQMEQMQKQIEYLLEYIQEEIKRRYAEDIDEQTKALVRMPKIQITKLEDYIYNTYKKDED
ncbi:MAG TPA: MerR family transcriptional regulator [Persephonella sp.]|nr:MerR family transcriptional regulator [Hydrogenothermaceae bacterium]HIQ25560.1 MerR family transcriptional regulator [Persephonella sp.]